MAACFRKPDELPGCGCGKDRLVNRHGFHYWNVHDGERCLRAHRLGTHPLFRGKTNAVGADGQRFHPRDPRFF